MVNLSLTLTLRFPPVFSPVRVRSRARVCRVWPFRRFFFSLSRIHEHLTIPDAKVCPRPRRVGELATKIRSVKRNASVGVTFMYQRCIDPRPLPRRFADIFKGRIDMYARVCLRFLCIWHTRASIYHHAACEPSAMGNFFKSF